MLKNNLGRQFPWWPICFHGLVQFYISKQWLNKFETFAEPGE